MVAISEREYAIFAALAAFIVGLSVLRRSRRAEATPQRTEVFSRMGFFESTRDQVFGDKFQAIEHAIDGASRLSHWIGKGSSALGETLIFDLAELQGPPSSPAPTSYTAIGFRVGGLVPYFMITYQDSLNRLVQNAFDKATGSGAGVTPTGEPLFDVPLVSAEKPDLAKHYRVLASDPDWMRQALSPAFVEALGRIDGRKLHISKWGTEWLFFYRYAIYPLSPQDNPALLNEAVGLLSLLDLRAADASR
jgi:hypothetical protein